MKKAGEKSNEIIHKRLLKTRAALACSTYSGVAHILPTNNKKKILLFFYF